MINNYTGLFVDIALFILQLCLFGFCYSILTEYKLYKSETINLSQDFSKVRDDHKVIINKLNTALDMIAYLQRKEQASDKIFANLESSNILTNFADVIKRFDDLEQRYKIISAKISDLNALNLSRFNQLIDKLK